METVNEQTDIISALGKTARKTLDTNSHRDDNNDDIEFASSGFYVREKPTKKTTDCSDDVTVENGDSKDNNEQTLVNGTIHIDQASSITTNGNVNEKSNESIDSDELSSERKDIDEVESKSDSGEKTLSQVLPEISKNNSELASSCETTEEEVSKTDKSLESNEEANANSYNECNAETNDETDSQIANKSDSESKEDDSVAENVDSNEEKASHDDAEHIEEAVSNTENRNEDEVNSKKDGVEISDKHDDDGHSKKEDVDIIESENIDDESNVTKDVETNSSENKEVEAISENNDQCQRVSENKEDPVTETQNGINSVSENKDQEEVSENKEESEPKPDTQKDVKSMSENKDQCQEVSENKEKPEAESKKKNDTNKDENTETGTEKTSENKENDVTSSTNNIDEVKSSKNDADNEVSSTSNSAEPTEVDKEDNVAISSPPRDERDLECLGLLRKELVKPVIDNSYMYENMDMDEDFDPTLLCPDISMDVDEQQPVETDYSHGDTPMLYEPIFCTLVDEITGAEVQIDLTPEEMEIRKKMYGSDNPVQTTKIHCTACNQHLGSAMAGAHNRFVHPLLKVLICKTCYHFYTSGEFEKDEDGSELYCRWCGQGGQVLCCSSCEYVFCKRCIRNNFGTKKFKEIRDSEDWNCFRCHPEQLSRLRAECAEFMEWYRTERARTNAMGQTDQDKVDFTKCCSGPPKKKDEPKPAASTSRRRKKNEDDPDYDPIRLEDEPPAKRPVPIGGLSSTTTTPGSIVKVNNQNRSMPTTPRPVGTPTGVRLENKTLSGHQVFKVGATTFKTRVPLGNVQRPQMGQAIRTSTPGYIKLVPANHQQTTATRPAISGTTPTRINQTTVRPVKQTAPPMKHEWFEKTVRSAARVNSNLSFTLTQLNRQQSQAVNVEALARVHNKLQEVLSTTINSLIQIRKNLRSEFIQGIKNMKVTPRPTPTVVSAPIIVADDDDVILVTPTTTKQTVAVSPAVTVKKKLPNPVALQISKPPLTTSKPPPLVFTTTTMAKSSSNTTTTASNAPQPRTGGFLKVRSLTALQTVPSECITIPDDPPPVVDPNASLRYSDDPMVGMDDSITIADSPPKPSNNPIKIVGAPVNTVVKAPVNTVVKAVSDKLDGIIEIHDDPPKVTVADKKVTRRRSTQSKSPTRRASTQSKSPTEQSNFVYNIKQTPSKEIRHMMGAHVNLVRSDEIEKRLKSTSTAKGDVSDINPIETVEIL